jgi:hypothetical protein
VSTSRASPFHARTLLVRNQRTLLSKDGRDGRKLPIADRSEAASSTRVALLLSSVFQRLLVRPTHHLLL